MLPILGGQFLEDSRAKYQVQRDDFPQLRKAGPFDEFLPRLSAGRVETLYGRIYDGHGQHAHFINNRGSEACETFIEYWLCANLVD